LNFVKAAGCSCPDQRCPTCGEGCECGGGCECGIEHYCNSCIGGKCSDCSGSPCPTEEIAKRVNLISLLVDNDGPLFNDPLIENPHTYKDCADAGGEIVASDDEQPQCRFTIDSCPDGWTQYKQWSTTTPNSKTGMSSLTKGWCSRTDCNDDTCLYTTPVTHSWGNKEQESCTFCGSWCPSSCACSWSDSVSSTITQVGCY